MLTQLTIEDFRGKSATHKFGPVTRLLGRNEAGKSGIKEAICYAYAGTDSTGARNPTHFISHGAEGLKVEVSSDKGTTISRVLKRKGTPALSIIRNGVRTPCSQEQLSKALGASPDLFLSSFLPGYFMTLTEDKRRAVLNEVLPPLDRRALLEELVGFALDENDLITIGNLNRRPDLIASAVSATRRTVATEYAKLAGQITTCEVMAKAELVAPPPCGAAAQLEVLSKRAALWHDYKHRRAAWYAAVAEFDKVNAWNDNLASERAAAESELALIEIQPVPAVVDHRLKKDELSAGLQPLPPKPALLNLPEGDRCPCCGQVVGSKHREKVKADTALIQSKYEEELTAIRAANEDITGRIALLRKEEEENTKQRRAVELANAMRAAAAEKLRVRIAGLVDRPTPEVGPQPVEPTTPYSPEEESRLREQLAAHQRAVGQYEHAVRQKEGAAATMSSLIEKAAPLALAVERYERIEAAIGGLPQKELSLRAEQLTIDGYTFSLEGTSVTRGDGIPYGILSTGAAIKADIMLCLKFNQLMGAKAPKVIFVDNADLVDSLDVTGGMQYFLAYVRQEHLSLKVEVG
jgi:hypothetical protein